MPAVLAPAKVLVTGVNGYVGIWVAETYLAQGYSVRGSVRSSARTGKHLRDAFAKYGDNFELVEVADISAPGAFDDAVEGIDVVAHTASPVSYDVEDPAQVIDPAVKGTLSILQSILARGNEVKRVVLTSSVVAIFQTPFTDKPTTFTEKDWNDKAVQAVQEKGKDTDGATIYAASKVLAEKAAWAFIEEHEPTWDLAALNPPYVWGPPIHDVQDADKLNLSQKILFDILTGALSDDAYGSEAHWHGAVDVHDVALAHVRATQLPHAGGTRALIVSFGGYPQDILDIGNALQPRPWDSLPSGPKPGSHKRKDPLGNIDTAQFGRVYGFQLRSIGDTVRDSLEDFQMRGWIR